MNDTLDDVTLRHLASGGTKMIALRSAGFNNVDLAAARTLGLTVARVPAYSPHSVAEHAVALILTLNRDDPPGLRACPRRQFLPRRIAGIRHAHADRRRGRSRQIGAIVAKILSGFGCRVLAYDIAQNPECVALGARYVTLDELWAQADIVTLHAPLTSATRHMVDAAAIAKMKPGVIIVNTSRGALVDIAALIEGLKSRHVGSVGLDVYEEEEHLFFQDLSSEVITDDVFTRPLRSGNELF